MKVLRMPVDVLGLIYAGVVAAGGLIGYLKAGNTFDLQQALY